MGLAGRDTDQTGEQVSVLGGYVFGRRTADQRRIERFLGRYARAVIARAREAGLDGVVIVAGAQDSRLQGFGGQLGTIAAFTG